MKTKEMEKYIKKGICKCGEEYGYIGLDMGLCTKCLDSLEKEK